MELAGDEKRIQALFSELSFKDQTHAPRFEQLWRGAELKASGSRRIKSLVFVAATVLVVFAGMLVAWLRFTSVQRSVEHHVQKPQQFETPTAPPASGTERVALVPRSQRSRPNRHRSLARLKQTDRTLQQQAAMLANWQSPTDKFMTLPTASVFNSLPQLNQSAKDLESFLPKNSQQMKESNQ